MHRAQTNPRARLLQRFCLLVVAALVPTLSCSDDGGERKPPKQQAESPFSSYSIKIYSGSARKRVDLPPVGESSLRVPFDRLLAKSKAPPAPKAMAAPEQLPPKEAKVGDLGPKLPGSKPQASVDTPDGGVALDGDLSTRAGWALVYGAAFECGMVVRSPGSGGSAALYPNAQVPVVPPWKEPGSYFIFRSGPSACDHQLAYEETLLCIADKLAEIADTPASVTWSKVPEISPYPELPPGPWVIPPQASKDRFIARDLAVHLVAVLGFTDLTLRASAPGASSTTWTCATAYGEAAKVTTASPAAVVQNHLDLTFGALDNSLPFYLPPKDLTITADHFDDLAAARVIFNAHVLRAAGRLLRDQIPKGVVADMAGGEQQRARATDPLRGAKLLWGETTDADRPYNSLAHATRFSTGRWERGLLEGITALTTCSTVPPMDQLTEGMRAEFSARSRDLPVQTADQEFAAKLLDQAGIVVPEAKVLGASIQTLRGAVLDQLLANAAAVHGVSPADPDFNSWGEGNAIRLMFGKLADEDVRFGLLRGFNNYRQLASADDQTIAVAKANPGGGLVANATVASLETLGAVAIDGGTPRKDLATDITARVGGVQMAAQCDEFGGLAGALLADYGYFAAFQDVFHIGDTLRKRLVALREEAALFSSPDKDAVKVPLGGSVEIRTWAGPGRMVLTAEAGRFGGPGLMRLFLLGFNPEDFAVTTPEAIADEVVLTYGKPWVADCAARTRASCPTNFDTAYLARATAHTVWSNVDPTTLGFDRNWARIIGSDGVIIELDFDLAAAGGQFLPQYISNGNPDERVHVVARHDPLAPTGKGRVLGSMATRTNGGYTSAVVSNLQKKLWNDTLGIGNKFVLATFLPYGPTAATPPAYCIEGINREPFVPLENELTSDADPYENSWRHYLDLAKSAAAHADELGNNLIKIGLEQDLRREAAGEEVAELCGDYTALDKVPFDKKTGTIGKSDTDAALNTCISEERRHIVFLTTEPPELLQITDQPQPPPGKTKEQLQTEWLRNKVLRCKPVAEENPLCNASQYPVLTHAGLGITKYTEPSTATTTDCEKAVQVVESITKQGLKSQSLQQLAGSSWVSQPGLLAALSQLQIVVAADGEWKATASGADVMDTKPGSLWPGCLSLTGQPTYCGGTSGTGSPPGANADPLALTFNRIFRPDMNTYSGSAGDKHFLLWRVEGVLWMLGGIAGQVPAKTVVGYVPFAKLASTPDGSTWPPTAFVSVPTLYAHSKYVQTSPGTWRLDVTGLPNAELTDTDVKLVGDAIPVSPGFDYDTAHLLAGAPQWIRDIYQSPSGRYLHVAAQNVQYTPADFVLEHKGNLTKAYQPADEGPNVIKADAIGTWLTHRAADFAGLKCAFLGGLPMGTTPKMLEGQTWIGLAKAPGYYGALSQSFPYPPEQKLTPHVWAGANTATGGFPLNCSPQESSGPFTTIVGHAGCATGGNTFVGQKGSPDDRMQVFVNSYPPTTVCVAGGELTQAVALGCVLSRDGLLPVPTTPPPIQKVADIQKLERWVGELERFSGTALSRLYLQNIPKRVVDDFNTGAVGTGSLKGEHGQLVLQMESSIRDIGNGWQQVSGRLGKIRAAIQGAELSLDFKDVESKIETEQIAIQRWQVHSKIAHAIADSISGFGFNNNPFSVVGGVAQTGAAVADLEIANKELAALGSIEDLQKKLKDNKMLQVLLELEDSTNSLYSETYTALTNLQQSTATTAQLSEQLRFAEISAQYQAAKGGGADFAMIDGEAVKFPVNIVLNRQYDITKRRYETALLHARYLAYVARLAIEQRIGMRLESFPEKLGPLEPPSEWAPDVCKLHGVDYEALRDIVVPDGGFSEGDASASNGAAGEFADMFIGDYVDKLEKFVELYNMEYPSHDGDDIAVVSLRDDLLGPESTCVEPSPNLLLHSSDLTQQQQSVDESGAIVTRGWIRRTCTSTDPYCLRLGIAASLNPPPAAPGGGIGGGVTWLYEVPFASVTDQGELAMINAAQPPARIVYQDVQLEAGPHVLSWWDQARATTGAAATQPSPNYPVVVFDSQGAVIKSQVNTPHFAAADAGSAEQWSGRREMPFTVSTPGHYRVAFSAAESGGGPGSVAIANVQVEKGTAAGPYWANGSSPLVLNTNCAITSVAALQQAFVYKCDAPGNCYYQLDAPFSIDTRGLDAGGTKLLGKVAANNFNYRHITVGLNFVGTGVVDCTLEPTASCFGSPYVEFTLDHAAFDVEVLSHKRVEESQHFNFGLGSINRGKALAAERFITLPISSADQQLLSQSAFEKNEYRGRPLDGSYRLRIHDKPSLRWNKIEDIQFVLKYRYWSRITLQPTPQ